MIEAAQTVGRVEVVTDDARVDEEDRPDELLVDGHRVLGGGLVATLVTFWTARLLPLLLPIDMGVSFRPDLRVFLFATGRLAVNAPAVLNKYEEVPYTDPLPQALVLTAIVISFGMTAVIVMIALGAYLSSKDDHIDMAAQDSVDDAGEDA